MATLTTTEQARGRVSMMRPELVSALVTVMNNFERQTGYKTTLPEYGGVRTSAEQQQLLDWRVAEGASYPVGSPETSRHVYGSAFDLQILTTAGQHVPDTSPLYGTLATVGEAAGLVAGYRFANRDQFHFELRESLADAQGRWASLVSGRLRPAPIAVDAVAAPGGGVGMKALLIPAGVALALMALDA